MDPAEHMKWPIKKEESLPFHLTHSLMDPKLGATISSGIPSPHLTYQCFRIAKSLKIQNILKSLRVLKAKILE
jgi:hypothetical protein